MIGFGLLIAALRTACVPVGSFREALSQVELGMSAEQVRDILGPPNLVCTAPAVDNTAEVWVYSERRPREPVPESAEPACRAPTGATELGFDRDGTLEWIVEEAGSTPVRGLR